MGDTQMSKLDPKPGQLSEVSTGRGSRPRCVATAPDDMLWVAYNGNGKLAKLDPAAMKVVKEYPLPHGEKSPYAVNTDGAGIIRGQRNRYRHRGALRPQKRTHASDRITGQHHGHPQNGSRCARAALIHGQPQRTLGRDRIREAIMGRVYLIAIIAALASGARLWFLHTHSLKKCRDSDTPFTGNVNTQTPLCTCCAAKFRDGQWEHEARELALAGRKIQAIKLVRERTALNLKSAREYV